MAYLRDATMNILFCNKYFFLNGGTERYLRTMMEHLSGRGHGAIPFSVRYAGSWRSPFERFFLDPPGAPEAAHFSNIRLGCSSAVRHLDRAIYSVEARLRLARLLDHVKPIHVAYLLNVYNYLSPSIIHTLKRRNIPVVLRLGDYNLQCASYLFLRDGKPCQLCMHGDFINGLRYRCVKGSAAVSAVRVFSMYLQRWLRVYDHVDAFVVPSTLMKTCLVAGGYPRDRIHVMRTPVPKTEPLPRKPGRHVLYFGRIAFEKGLDTLLEAYQESAVEPDLVLVGKSFDGERERLQRLIRPQWRHRIHFVGFREGEALERLIREAWFTVVPSRWFDNAPQSLTESLAHGVPVLAARIGAIPEQVQDGVTGRLFTPDHVEELREALRWMISDPHRLERMGREGRRFVEVHHDLDRHTEGLLRLFSALQDRAGRTAA